MIGPPAEPLHPPEITKDVVEKAQADAPPDEHVPPVDRVRARHGPLEQGEGVTRGVAGDVGADDAGGEVGQALDEGLLVEELGSAQRAALLQRRGRGGRGSGGGRCGGEPEGRAGVRRGSSSESLSVLVEEYRTVQHPTRLRSVVGRP